MRREGVSFLVGAARDVLTALSSERPAMARATIERWADSASPLLRRLAVNGIREADGIPPDDKLRWILERGLVFEPSVKHEVFEVIAAAYPWASDEARNALLERVRRGVKPEDEPRLDERTREYERYNMMYWLSKVAPNDELVQELFRKEQGRHPDFAPRDDPDLEVGDVRAWNVRSSISPEELLKKRAGDTRVAKRLMSFEDPSDRGGPDRYAFLGVVGQAVAMKPVWGIRLGQSLQKLSAWNSDLWRGLMEGWSRAQTDQREWAAIFMLLKEHRHPETFAHDSARLLVDFIQSQSSAESEAVRASEEFSDALWASLDEPADSNHLKGPDWLTMAINQPGGKLTEFWLRLLSLRAQDSSTGRLPERARERFADILGGTDNASIAGRILLASQLHFLLAIDTEWTTASILPLFEWETDEKRAEQAWQGYLIWVRLDEAVIDKMLPRYVATFPRLKDRDEEWRQRFTEHLAIIAVRSARNPIEDEWLVPFVTQAGVASRASWASHVAFLLRSLESEGKHVQWNKWLRTYWSDRLKGIPRQLALQEAGEMAAWAVSLDSVFTEAVALLARGPAGRPKSYVYDLLDERGLPEEQPAAVLGLLSHVLQAEETPFYSCHHVVSALHKIRSHPDLRNELEAVVERLVGLGCEQALATLE